MNLVLSNEELLLYWKREYWKKGIPAYQFKREHISDINDIMEIDNIMKDREKQQRHFETEAARVG